MLSAKTEYALLALLRLAQEYAGGEPLQGKRLATEERIPEGFLAQILGQLKRLGLVTSVRGACGGYRLACPPEELTLGGALEQIEGTPSRRMNLSEATPLSEALTVACNEAQQAQRASLERVTLAELAARSATASMYYI